MTEIKSCISCVHCHKAYGDYWCMKYKIDTIDYVTGKTDWDAKRCSQRRKSGDQCGPDAIGWEEKPPEKKMSMWKVFRDFTKEMFGF